jgi:hypothetical protein
MSEVAEERPLLCIIDDAQASRHDNPAVRPQPHRLRDSRDIAT